MIAKQTVVTSLGVLKDCNEDIRSPIAALMTKILARIYEMMLMTMLAMILENINN